MVSKKIEYLLFHEVVVLGFRECQIALEFNKLESDLSVDQDGCGWHFAALASATRRI